MIRHDELDAMERELFVYDVVEGAWGQEPDGFEANARHVLTHLSKDLSTKDFNDPVALREQIAPDMTQYAIRLARWSGQSVRDLRYPIDDAMISELDGIVSVYTGRGIAHCAIIGASGVIAANLHDLDHSSSHDAAVKATPEMAQKAGGFLLKAASLYATAHRFDLTTAFSSRLSALRARSDFPAPN